MNILEVCNISKKISGVSLVKNLSFSVEKGSISSVIGPNGAGKTTAINLITGLLKPDKGNIFLNNREITKLSPNRIVEIGIGRTFQETRLFQNLTVLENIMVAFKYAFGWSLISALIQSQDMKKKETMYLEKAFVLLEQVGLLNKRNELSRNLSFGQKRLLEITRVIALEPKLILLDEPMSGLAPVMIDRIESIINSLCESGVTILLVEHNMKVVMNISNRVIVLNHGQFLVDGTPQEIIDNQMVVDAYLGRKYSVNS
jgi:branched-chain amino acid transport system ATP-binding protein